MSDDITAIPRVWGIEDKHGHRYMAQVADGKDRWLLPLSRKEFEELWAAVAQKNPELDKVFRGPQNFLRQVIGNTMHWLLEQDWEPTPHLRAMALQMQLGNVEASKQSIRDTLRVMQDTSMPNEIRLSAVDILLGFAQDELRSVSRELTYEALHEWAHAIEMEVQ
jgi:hypothetical protein